MATELCACGQPLHYAKKGKEDAIRRVIAEKGEYSTVTTPDGTWLVQRHYIALHGLKADELPSLGFQKVS